MDERGDVQSEVHRVVVSTTTTAYPSSSLNPRSLSLSHYMYDYHQSITHLHLRSHLVQSFSEFGVVLPISHCTSHKKRAYLQERLLSPGSVFVYQLASSLFSYREDIQVMAFANSPSVLANFPLISNHLIASSIFPCCRQS